jgi:hypothetical protein
MLWNSSATISMVARSTGVAAACFSACLRCASSSSKLGVLTEPAPPLLDTVEAPRNALLRLADGRAQAGRCRRRLPRGIAEAGKMTTHEPVQPTDHRFGGSGPRTRPPARVIMRVSSPTSVRTSVSGPRLRAASAVGGPGAGP